MLILVFKVVNNFFFIYLSDLFIIRENIKNLRGINKFVIFKVNIIRYGIKFVVYIVLKVWNLFSDILRCMKIFKDFKIAVRFIVNLYM